MLCAKHELHLLKVSSQADVKRILSGLTRTLATATRASTARSFHTVRSHSRRRRRNSRSLQGESIHFVKLKCKRFIFLPPLKQRFLARQRPRLLPRLRPQQRRERRRRLPGRLRPAQGDLDAAQPALGGGAPRGVGADRAVLQPAAERAGRGARDGHRVARPPLLAQGATLLPGMWNLCFECES